MKQPLQKGLFYVIENDGMAEPGFLVFLNGAAPVFLHTKTKAAPPCTLRMRVSPTLGEGGGSILIATLDAIQHTLRIEDVWMWKGQAIYDTQGYSKRREYLKEFVERCWVPDARLLGGIQTTILNPRSVQDFLETPATSVSTIELIPEMAGKRRMWQGGGTPPFPPSQTTSKDGGSDRPTIPQPATTKKRFDLAESPPIDKKITLAGAQAVAGAQVVPACPPTIKFSPLEGAGGTGCPPLDKNFTRAIAKAVDKMPDIYDLCDEDGRIVGQGSVQQFSLSQTLRSKHTTEGVLVAVRWRDEFGGYEITGLF